MTAVLFALVFAFTNAIAGRWADIVGNAAGGRLIFRAIVPGILAGLLAFQHSFDDGLIAWFAVTAGSCVWFTPGWSFDEINGLYDPTRYPKLIRTIGLTLFPPDISESTARKRGILMKGFRGLYDFFTFALLIPINPWAITFWPLTACQGLVYWACGRVWQKYAVVMGEFAYGAVRGLLIYYSIT